MELKKRVTTLELSKRLKELGVPQNSLFYWNNKKIICPTFKEFNTFDNNWFSAFTPAELGQMLHEDYFVYKTENGFCYSFMTEHGDILFIDDLRYEETEADAKARLLMYQIEKGLIKVEDLK